MAWNFNIILMGKSRESSIFLSVHNAFDTSHKKTKIMAMVK